MDIEHTERRLAYAQIINVATPATDLWSPSYASAQVGVPCSPTIPMKLRLHLQDELHVHDRSGVSGSYADHGLSKVRRAPHPRRNPRSSA